MFIFPSSQARSPLRRRTPPSPASRGWRSGRSSMESLACRGCTPARSHPLADAGDARLACRPRHICQPPWSQALCSCGRCTMRASVGDMRPRVPEWTLRGQCCRHVGMWRHVGSSTSARPGRSRLARQLLRVASGGCNEHGSNKKLVTPIAHRADSLSRARSCERDGARGGGPRGRWWRWLRRRSHGWRLRRRSLRWRARGIPRALRRRSLRPSRVRWRRDRGPVPVLRALRLLRLLQPVRILRAVLSVLRSEHALRQPAVLLAAQKTFSISPSTWESKTSVKIRPTKGYPPELLLKELCSRYSRTGELPSAYVRFRPQAPTNGIHWTTLA